MMKTYGKKTLQVSMEMGRSSNDVVNIRISDEASGAMVAEVELSMEAFGDLLTSRPAIGTCERYESDNYGKRMENKSVRLPAKKYGDMDAIKKAAKEWERANPEWKVDGYDLRGFNRHRMEDGTYQVNVRRWVSVGDGE